MTDWLLSAWHVLALVAVGIGLFATGYVIGVRDKALIRYLQEREDERKRKLQR